MGGSLVNMKRCVQFQGRRSGTSGLVRKRETRPRPWMEQKVPTPALSPHFVDLRGSSVFNEEARSLISDV